VTAVALAWSRSLSSRASRRLDALGRSWSLALFVELPILAVGFVVGSAFLIEFDSLGDFTIFRDAAREVLHGQSPYVAVDAEALAGADKFVYPPVAAFLFVPFTLLPLAAAKAAFIAVSLGATMLALRLLGVRDWRCYGLSFLLAPTITAIGVGALGPLLVLAAAAAWRYRAMPVVAGLAVVLAVSVKLFLWPLGVWLFATRRLRAGAVAILAGTVLVLAPWSAIGFAGLRQYPDLLRTLTDVMRWKAYSPSALGTTLGLSPDASRWGELALAALAVVAIVLLGRGRDADRRAFIGAVAAALLVTPVVWMHYLVLLLAPLALTRPRLSPLWFAPLLLWATPRFDSGGEAWRILVVLGVVTVVLAAVFDRSLPAPTRARDAH